MLRRLLRGKWLFACALVCCVRASSAQWATQLNRTGSYIDAESYGENAGGFYFDLLYEHRQYIYFKKSFRYQGGVQQETGREGISLEGGYNGLIVLTNFGDYLAGSGTARFYKTSVTFMGPSGTTKLDVDQTGTVTIFLRRSTDPLFSFIADVSFDGPFGAAFQAAGRYAETVEFKNGMKSVVVLASMDYWAWLDAYRVFDRGEHTSAENASQPAPPWGANLTGKNFATWQGLCIIDPGEVGGAVAPTTVPSTTQPTTEPSTQPDEGSGELTWEKLKDYVDTTQNLTGKRGFTSLSPFGETLMESAEKINGMDEMTPAMENMFLCFPTEDVTGAEAASALDAVLTHFEVTGGGVRPGIPDSSLLKVESIVGAMIAAAGESSPVWPVIVKVRAIARPIFTFFFIIAFVQWVLKMILWASGMADAEATAATVLNNGDQ